MIWIEWHQVRCAPLPFLRKGGIDAADFGMLCMDITVGDGIGGLQSRQSMSCNNLAHPKNTVPWGSE